MCQQGCILYIHSKKSIDERSCLALRGYCWEREQSQAGLYGQIVRWFQNHAYLDRTDIEDGEEDNESTLSHLSELEKEVQKCCYDEAKVARLMSLSQNVGTKCYL